jgi:hypothetical protein
MNDVMSSVREEVRKRVPPARITLQPGNVVPVNMPLIVSAADPGNQDFAITLPQAGTVSVRPTYRWDFGDGGTATGRGKPFDGVTPRQDPGRYVTHTYTRPFQRVTVSLTVTWHATLTIPGVGSMSLQDVVMPPVTHTMSVQEARAVLVAGD